MSATRRVTLGLAILSLGWVAQAGLEQASRSHRPPLRQPLATLPFELGDWIGRDEPMDPEILEKTQATDHLNRVYRHRRHPARELWLWINYSDHGLNMRHSPEICLPSTGWEKVESRCRVMEVNYGADRSQTIMRLGYAKEELSQGIGFWYYIFGEGPLERAARALPLTSRSSHGRTTRGSGLTVEVFCPDAIDPDGEALRDFATALLEALDPILPEDRDSYYIP